MTKKSKPDNVISMLSGFTGEIAIPILVHARPRAQFLISFSFPVKRVVNTLISLKRRAKGRL
jgi:hypothetical protein